MQKFDIFLNGDLAETTLQVQPLLSTPTVTSLTVYVADGGYRHLLQYPVPASRVVWLGDFDSSTPPADCPHEVLRFSCQKDFSDFGAILDLIGSSMDQNAVWLNVVGGLGGRRDHERINVQEAEHFARQRPALIVFQAGLVVASVGFRLDTSNGERIGFSLMSPGTYPLSVRVTGAEYSGEIVLTRPSHGLSNRVAGNSLEVHPFNGAVVTCAFCTLSGRTA